MLYPEDSKKAIDFIESQGHRLIDFNDGYGLFLHRSGKQFAISGDMLRFAPTAHIQFLLDNLSNNLQPEGDFWADNIALLNGAGFHFTGLHNQFAIALFTGPRNIKIVVPTSELKGKQISDISNMRHAILDTFMYGEDAVYYAVMELGPL